MGKAKKQPFIFGKHERLGAEGAEQDEEFLSECFVDVGDMEFLRDPEKPQRILVGRTGSGKTALLLTLQAQEEHVAWIEPEELSLQYLSNSTILKVLEELGVNLDLFYRLLWRHIFAVELIKLKYRVHSEEDDRNIIQGLLDTVFRKKARREAMDYFREWGSKFWEDTETRVHEVTEHLESDVRASLGAKARFLEGDASARTRLGAEERRELVHRIQEVVNRVQIQKLGQIIKALAEDVFTDPKERFYIVIDRLDEHWVEDRFRYRLIRALIETIRDLQKIRTAKVVIALRIDLLQRVIRETRDAGFQEEKYEPLYLRLRWTKEELLELLDLRVQALVRRKYTSRPVGWREVFPSKMDKTGFAGYLLKRTLYRPRDIIQFANACLESAVGRAKLTATLVKEAEAKYSERRFRSLGDEWESEYPGLLTYASVLRRRPKSFRVAEVSLEEIERLCVKSIGSEDDMNLGRLRPVIRKVFYDQAEVSEVRNRVIKAFYEVGLVGLRTEVGSKVAWSFLGGYDIKESEIQEDARVEINPAFYRVLGIKPRAR